jgi:uncharacterized membrane protein
MLGLSVGAKAVKFIPFTVPGATGGTFAHDINNKGVVVGEWDVCCSDGGIHAFVRFPNGSFIVFDIPGAEETFAEGINNKGEVVGQFSDVSSDDPDDDQRLGFYRSLSAFFSKINVPGAEGSVANGINKSSQIVGECTSDIGSGIDPDTDRSFLLASPFGIPQVTKFDPPGVVCTDCDRSEAFGVNDGTVISGTFSNPSLGGDDTGYIRSTGGFYSSVNFPTSTTETVVRGINNKGQFVGYYFPGSGPPTVSFIGK